MFVFVFVFVYLYFRLYLLRSAVREVYAAEGIMCQMFASTLYLCLFLYLFLCIFLFRIVFAKECSMPCMPRKAWCVRCLDKAATLNTGRTPLRPHLLSSISTYKLLNSKANTHLNNRNTFSSASQDQIVQRTLCDTRSAWLLTITHGFSDTFEEQSALFKTNFWK